MEINGNPDVRDWFPSEDGNPAQRERMMELIEQLVRGVDELKNPEGVNLKGEKTRDSNFYGGLAEQSVIPGEGAPMQEVNAELLKLLHGHPYHTKYFFTNILPMASIPGMLGMLTAMLVNGNNLWDVYGPAGAEAEVRVIAMMSKLVGYDARLSGGYTTWGGQGAVFSGLRIAIAKYDPGALKHGGSEQSVCFLLGGGALQPAQVGGSRRDRQRSSRKSENIDRQLDGRGRFAKQTGKSRFIGRRSCLYRCDDGHDGRHRDR
ncbi:hypothetical protein HMSSN036_05840 [Paenibacillus macerans]|nr:hypothetical protein HMSSN036_05840 [Paenibacillus macerans]